MALSPWEIWRTDFRSKIISGELSTPKVYLTGGMRTGWQNWFIQSYPEVEFLDSRILCQDPIDTPRQRDWIRTCHFMLAFWERDNPIPTGMALEMGFAAALGKPIWYLHNEDDPGRNLKLSYMAQFSRAEYLDRKDHFPLVLPYGIWDPDGKSFF